MAVLRHLLALNAVGIAVALCWNLGPHYRSLTLVAYLVVGAVVSLLVKAVYGHAMQVACLYFHIVVLLPPSDPASDLNLAFGGAMAWHGLGMAAVVALEVVRIVMRDVFIRPKFPPREPQLEIDS
jgi:hypothetical protein